MDLNRFVYVANNPIINADPTGLFITSILGWTLGMYAYKKVPNASKTLQALKTIWEVKSMQFLKLS